MQAFALNTENALSQFLVIGTKFCVEHTRKCGELGLLLAALATSFFFSCFTWVTSQNNRQKIPILHA